MFNNRLIEHIDYISARLNSLWRHARAVVVLSFDEIFRYGACCKF